MQNLPPESQPGSNTLQSRESTTCHASALLSSKHRVRCVCDHGCSDAQFTLCIEHYPSLCSLTPQKMPLVGLQRLLRIANHRGQSTASIERPCPEFAHVFLQLRS